LRLAVKYPIIGILLVEQISGSKNGDGTVCLGGGRGF